MHVQALIQAAGLGTRLGLGPKALVTLDGRTLVEHTVDLFRGLVDSIIIAAPKSCIENIRLLLGSDNIILIEGGNTRSETTRNLLKEASAPWLVLHDVVHPFATRELLEALLEAAYLHGSAAPGLENTEYLYNRNGDLLHGPGEVLVGQKPVAFSRDLVEAAYGKIQMSDFEIEPSLMQVLEQAGTNTQFVPGSAQNIKITETFDLQFAEAMIATKRRA